jgi:hypothetical protein
MEGIDHFRVGDLLLLVHQSISRGIHMASLYSCIFSRRGFPDGKIRPGFADYVRSLVALLRAHHLGEEQLTFPRFQESLPEAPYDLLTAQHHQMGPLVDELRIKIDRAVDGVSAQESLERLDAILTEIAGIWRPHVDLEETYFSPEKIDAMMGADEQADLLARIGELNQKHAGPDYLVVPFTLFNLPQGDRGIISATMPPVVTQHLIPVAWKDKWLPMSPFLLV